MTFSYCSLVLKKEVNSELANPTLPSSERWEEQESEPGSWRWLSRCIYSWLGGWSSSPTWPQGSPMAPWGPTLPRSSQIKEASRTKSALYLIHYSMLRLYGGVREALRRSGEMKHEVHMWVLWALSNSRGNFISTDFVKSNVHDNFSKGFHHVDFCGWGGQSSHLTSFWHSGKHSNWTDMYMGE